MELTYKNNFSKVAKELEVSARRFELLSGDILDDFAQEVYTESQAEVPRATANLADSGSIEKKRSRGVTEVTIGYGISKDPVNPITGQHASEYMVKVHEDLTAKHPNGGKAKFLEDPMRRAEARFANAMDDKLNNLLTKVFGK